MSDSTFIIPTSKVQNYIGFDQSNHIGRVGEMVAEEFFRCSKISVLKREFKPPSLLDLSSPQIAWPPIQSTPRIDFVVTRNAKAVNSYAQLEQNEPFKNLNESDAIPLKEYRYEKDGFSSSEDFFVLKRKVEEENPTAQVFC